MDAAPAASVPEILKWRLFFRVLPLTAVFALAKLAVHSLGLEPWEFDSLTGSLFGAATFVLAFVLSGTLSSYNASEDMVVQCINAVESIDDIGSYLVAMRPHIPTQTLRLHLSELLHQLSEWLANRLPLEAIEARLQEINHDLAELRRCSEDSVADRALPELARLRILITRMASNRDHDFLGPAYAMLEIFLVGAVFALLLIGAERFSENMVVSCFLFTSFTYLLLLIRDLDNPFQYDGSSCVDVDLSGLKACRDRLLSPLAIAPGPARQTMDSAP